MLISLPEGPVSNFLQETNQTIYQVMVPKFIAAGVTCIIVIIILIIRHLQRIFVGRQKAGAFLVQSQIFVIIFVFFCLLCVSHGSPIQNENTQNVTQIQNSRTLSMVYPATQWGSLILGKVMKNGSGLVAAASSYLGLAWIADLLLEDSDNQDFPTYWLVVLAAAPAVLTLLCLYSLHWWRMDRQRRQEMAYQVQYLPHSGRNPITICPSEHQNEYDPRVAYARVARPHQGRDPSRRECTNKKHIDTQTVRTGVHGSPSPVRNISIAPFRA